MLAIVGGLFVLEAVSVIVQVISFKLTGKRVFRMAPLHHHFEQKGWTEPQIVIRFWIISIVLALAGLATLKLRMIPRHQLRRKESRAVRARRARGLRARARCSPAAPTSSAFDDSERDVEKARAAGIPVADLRHIDWSKIAALVLAPGVPLTHPAPHWTVGLARNAAVEVIGDIELFCRERRTTAPDAPFVAITGTNGKSTTTALVAHLLAQRELRRAARRQYRHRDPLAAAARAGARARDRVLVVPDRSRAFARSLGRHPAQRHRRPSRPPRHARAITRRSRSGWSPACSSGTAIVGVDDNWCQAVADRIERAGKRVERVSVRRPLSDGFYVEGDQVMRAAGGTARAVVHIGGIGSLRGAAQCAERRLRDRRRRSRSACRARGDPERACVSFPGLAHRMEQVGRKGNVLFVNDSKATNADAAGARARELHAIFSGSRAASRRPAASPSLAGYFPRIRKAYLIGEAAGEFAGTLQGKVPFVVAGTLDRAVELAARDAEASDAKEPVVLLSPACASYDQYRNFELRGAAFRDAVLALPGVTPDLTSLTGRCDRALGLKGPAQSAFNARLAYAHRSEFGCAMTFGRRQPRPQRSVAMRRRRCSPRAGPGTAALRQRGDRHRRDAARRLHVPAASSARIRHRGGGGADRRVRAALGRRCRSPKRRGVRRCGE